jgi:uncharacterized protein involved in exopolysaccharide biosynthesis
MQSEELQQFNLIAITKVGIKYRKHIIIFTLIGAALGIILSFIIKPKYEAFTIFYAPANSSISKSVLDNNNLEGLMEFGSEEQTDQMLQILNSDQIKEKVIQKFNLIAHYEIDQNDKYVITKVKRKFESNAEFKRTDYLAVKITITDENPDYAANMANYVGYILDSLKTNIQQQRTKQAFEIIKIQYFSKKKELDSLQKVLTGLRQKGIYDYLAQSEVLTIAIVKAETQLQEEEARVKVYDAYKNKLPDTTIIRAKGRLAAAKAAISSLKPRIETFGKYSGDYVENEALFEKQKEALAILQNKYENALVDFGQSINQKFIIDKAQKPEMKSYPNRLLVALITTLVAFLIGLFMAIYNDIILPNFKKA